MLRIRELVVVLPAQRGIGELVGCGGGKSMLGTSLCVHVECQIFIEGHAKVARIT